MEAFARSDDRIAREIAEDVMQRILFMEPDAVDVVVADGVVNLSGLVASRSEYRSLIELSKRVDGVIRVDHDDLGYTLDDRIGVDPQAPRL